MSLTSIPSCAIFRIQENYQQENSVTLKELINNNPTNENKLIKVIGGYEHTICLFNNGEMFGDGWNDYGQYGCNPLQINPEESKVNVTGMKKVNEKTNKILQDCKVIDVFTKFNFTIYLAINNTTKKQMLLGSGWNYGGCCSCNLTNDRHVNEISQCYFIQNKKNNEEEEMTTELKNEKIIQIACGGCHLFMLTENYLNNEQFIYECGKNIHQQLSEGKDVPILKKSVKLMDFIKVNENNELKIKQIEGGSNCASFLTGMFILL